MAKRYAIMGNSGSGKSTLAARIATSVGAPVLDLDTIYWQPENGDAEAGSDVPKARPLSELLKELDRFLDAHPSWIIEGCYGELVEHALCRNPTLLFVDPGVEACLRNCDRREWEPHKYSSRAAQDEMLPALKEWVRSYETRTDTMSRAYHESVFAGYAGEKHRLDESSEFHS